MAYVVELKRSAEKELERLPTELHDRVIKGLISLKGNPRPTGVKKLHGREGCTMGSPFISPNLHYYKHYTITDH